MFQWEEKDEEVAGTDLNAKNFFLLDEHAHKYPKCPFVQRKKQAKATFQKWGQGLRSSQSEDIRVIFRANENLVRKEAGGKDEAERKRKSSVN